MNRSEKKKSKEIFLTRERWGTFYRQHSLSLDTAMNFARVDVAMKIIAIENLFAPEKTSRGEKKKSFNIALTLAQYKSFVSASRQLENSSNKELKRAVKEVKTIHDRQKFRNVEVMKMLVRRFDFFIKEFKNNKSLQRLCKFDSVVGHKAKLFRNRRLEEMKEFRHELRRLQLLVIKFAFLNDIENCVKMYVDFLNLAQHRLESLKKDVIEALEVCTEELDVKMIHRKQKLNLRLPGWFCFQDSE